MLLPLHVAAGGLAILLGTVALLATKGATLHRQSGILFVGAMLTMGISGSILALQQSLANPNALGGVMSVYFVTTALLTVQTDSALKHWASILAAAVGAGVAVAWLRLGIRGVITSPPNVDPAMVYSTFVFGAAMILGVLGDLRVMHAESVGASRLRRHLWRMCVGLFIAVASFFAVPERVGKLLPQFFTTPPMRALPVLLVLLTMFYWLWRVRRRGVAGSPSVARAI
jgi:uncharacterized membrane protein